MVQAGANVTLEECEDKHNSCLSILWAMKVLNKIEVCNFCFKADANKTAIVGNLCGKFGTFLFSSCMRAMQSIWCDCESHTEV